MGHSAWATNDDRPIGNWTIITREDRDKQWTYKSNPIDVRFLGSPELRPGDGEDGKWHLVEP